MTTLAIDTKNLPIFVEKDDNLVNSSSSTPTESDPSPEITVVDIDTMPPAVVTPPISNKLLDNDRPACRRIIEHTESTETGDTESETSVASPIEALEVLFGKAEIKAEDVEEGEEKPDPEEDVIRPRLEPEGITGEEQEKAAPVIVEEEEEERTIAYDEDDNDNDEDEKKGEEETSENRAPVTACITPTASIDMLASPPRRMNRVSMTAVNFIRPAGSTPPFVSSAKTRRASAPAVAGTGLSELSKQLRVLQAKNQYMQSEMDRAQRQLKIMSESKGVSVADVLQTMEVACAREAHAELQSQVEGLQAQLEAHKAAKSPSRNSGADSAATQLEHDSLKQQVAALQLQLGHHEELQVKYREETKSLYEQVQTHQTSALTLESNVEQQTGLLEKEQGRTTALEVELTALTCERDLLKEKQTKGFSQLQTELAKNAALEKELKSLIKERDLLKGKHTRSVSQLQTEQAKTKALEAEITALHQERELLKERQAKRMADFWQDTFQKRQSRDGQGESWEGEVQKYLGLNRTEQKDNATSIPAPTNYPPPSTNSRPGLQRTYSDPALWAEDPDAKATITKSYVASTVPKYSSTYKQWTYDVVDDSHRRQLYVRQSAKNMELEFLLSHQQRTFKDQQEDFIKEKAQLQKSEKEKSQKNIKLELKCLNLEDDRSKDKAELKRLEQERTVAESRLNIVEQEVKCLKLDLRLEKEQAESLRGQLKRREEEYLLKREQMQSRLQVSKEQSIDLEGQLSSLYVAFGLVQEDRSEEQHEQAELKMRLVDADKAVAQEISKPAPEPKEDAAMAQDLSESFSSSYDMSESSESTRKETANLRARAGLLAPSPRRGSSTRSGSTRSSFFRSSSSSLRGLPLPIGGGRRASASDIVSGLPPTTAAQRKRRTSTGTAFDAPPPPGTTICKGFLMQAHTKKKKLTFQKEVGMTWKRKFFVLKRGEGLQDTGTFCFWFGDEPKGRVVGTIPHLIRGISTVSFASDCGIASDQDGPRNPNSFCIRINPNDMKAPEIHLAAYSAVEVESWRSVLKQALEVDADEWSEYEQRRAENQMEAAKSRNYAY